MCASAVFLDDADKSTSGVSASRWASSGHVNGDAFAGLSRFRAPSTGQILASAAATAGLAGTAIIGTVGTKGIEAKLPGIRNTCGISRTSSISGLFLKEEEEENPLIFSTEQTKATFLSLTKQLFQMQWGEKKKKKKWETTVPLRAPAISTSSSLGTLDTRGLGRAEKRESERRHKADPDNAPANFTTCFASILLKWHTKKHKQTKQKKNKIIKKNFSFTTHSERKTYQFWANDKEANRTSKSTSIPQNNKQKTQKVSHKRQMLISILGFKEWVSFCFVWSALQFLRTAARRGRRRRALLPPLPRPSPQFLPPDARCSARAPLHAPNAFRWYQEKREVLFSCFFLFFILFY